MPTATKNKPSQTKASKPSSSSNQSGSENQGSQQKAKQQETIVLNSKKADLFSIYIVADQDPIRISPGIKEFPFAMWLEAKLNPMVKNRLNEGSLVELKDPITGGFLEKIPESLADFSEMASAEMADSMMDMDTLEAWLKGEKRTMVKRAIDAQMKKIEQFTARIKAANSKK